MKRKIQQRKKVFRGAFAKAFFLSHIIKYENRQLLETFSTDKGHAFESKVEDIKAQYLTFVQETDPMEAMSAYILQNWKSEHNLVGDLFSALKFDHHQYYAARETLDEQLESAIQEIKNITLPIPGLEAVESIDYHRALTTESHYFAIGYDGGKEQKIRISNHAPAEDLPGYHHLILVQNIDNAVVDFKKKLGVIINNPPLKSSQRIESLYRKIGDLLMKETNNRDFEEQRNLLVEQAKEVYRGTKAEKKLADILFTYGQSPKMQPLYYEHLLRELTGINLHDIKGKLTYSQINTMLGASVSGGTLDRLAEKLSGGKLLVRHKGKKLKKGFNGLINYLVMTNARLYRSREKFLIDDLDQLYQHKREVVGMLMNVIKELKASPDYASERWMQALFVEERGNNMVVGFREGQRERVIVKSSFGSKKNLRDFLKLYESSGKGGQYPGGVQRKRGLSKYAQEVHEYYSYLKNQKQKRYDFLS